MRSAKGILFDFNGTLFFDTELHIKAFEIIFPMYGKEKPTREFLTSKVFGRTNASIYRDNFDKNATFEAADEFRRRKEEVYYQLCLADKSIFKLVDGVPEMLDYLKEKGIPYTIATGSGGEEVDFFFKHLGLGRWFDKDRIIYTDGTFNGKPAPDCYLLAAERIGLEAKDCIVFEDGTSGIRAAKAAGAAGVVAVFEEGMPSPLKEGITVDGVYHDLSDWRDILSQYDLL